MRKIVNPQRFLPQQVFSFTKSVLFKISQFGCCLLLGLFCFNSHVLASTLSFNGKNIDFSGYVTGGSHYIQHPSGNNNHVGTVLNDVLLNIGSVNSTAKPFSFYAGVGVLQQQDFQNTREPLAPLSVGLQYGWFGFHKIKNMRFEVGQLPTNLGYESSISAENKNIFLGELWSVLPTYYPAARWNLIIPNATLYAEINSSNTSSGPGFAFGVLGDINQIEYKANLFIGDETWDTFDLVLKKEISQIQLGFNFDYHHLKNSGPNQDENAFGIALYVSPKYKEWEIPVRLEVLSEGSTGIYGYKNGFSFTVTPTYHFSKSHYFRWELLYAQGNAKPFNDDGKAVKTQFASVFQFGLRF